MASTTAAMAASGGAKKVAELTIRGLILGVLITLVFTAANVYMGLKVGLTFATSIPAAVISMAILSVFKDSSILENNIVQTVASAAGTLSAIIFVLPGLLLIGWWTGFPFWTSFWVCAAGGILGVLFTIPLRRAMVTTSDLPYPEGRAAAEVLEIGTQAREAAAAGGTAESRQGLLAVVYGSIASLGLFAFTSTGIGAGEVTRNYSLDRVAANSATGFDMGFSLALLGAGYLVGLSVGMAMLFGLFIAWGAAVPILTHLMAPAAGMSVDDHANDIWRHQVRFIGAGAIAVAAIWTLLRLAKPVVSGVVSTLRASRARTTAHDTRDVDMSLGWIVLITVVCLAGIGYLLSLFLKGTPLEGNTQTLIITALPFIFFGGFLIAAICGYMAGLIGASNSPISGVGILAILICSVLLVAVIQPADAVRPALVAFALFATSVVFAIACISNNNLQDLKTGQLVGATPAAQQWALILGCIAGAAVIPPVLNLLAQGYGIAGMPHLPPTATHPLNAPQATLISALAQGVITQQLNFKMLAVGGVLGVVLVAIDEFLRARKWLRLPPLAVGIGIYLPMSATLPVVIGAIIGHWYDNFAKRQRNPERSKRLAVLVASGMIVGESLFGVILAGLIVSTSNDAPLGLVGKNWPEDTANWIGLAAFGGLIMLLYGWMMAKSRKMPAPTTP